MGGMFKGGDVFAKGVLGKIGAPTTPNNLELINAWGDFENVNPKYNNPLATTKTMPGAKSFNDAGVKAYKDWQQGVDATVATLQLGFYKDVVAALKAGDTPLSEFRKIVGSSKWGSWKAYGTGGSDSATAGTGTDLDSSVRKALEDAGLSKELIAAFASWNKTGKMTDQSLSSLLGGANTSKIGADFLGATAGTTINGGVTFNLNLAGQKLSEIKTMITNIIKDIGTVATTGAK